MKRAMAMLLAAVLMLAVCAQAELLTERMEILKSLGISAPDDFEAEVREAVRRIVSRSPDGADEDFFYDYGYLLSWMGMGRYDAAADAIVPYSDDVFAFDMEMYDVSGDYIDLLNAVARISGGSVIMEGCSVMPMGEALWSFGLGRQKVEFEMNGVPRVFSAKVRNDWMDVSVIRFLNECLEEDGAAVRVWCMYDQGQGMILFCRTPEWAAQFEAATGCRLYLDADEA